MNISHINLSKKSILPQKFVACGIFSGIKRSRRKDLGLIYSELPCKAVGMFTSNKVKSASLEVCRENLENKESRAIIVNSGNANCFVGQKGILDAKEITKKLADELGIAKKSVLIASTGIIGKAMPIKIIKEAIPALCKNLNNRGLKDFAEAILTTDTFKKVVTSKLKVKNKTVVITGIAKGAGMIYPKLEKGSKKHATMLVFILTDACIDKNLLQSALEYGIDKSFNCISIDGCTSTNDTVLLLANGAAQNAIVNKENRDFNMFQNGLLNVCQSLARMIIEDAEGGTKIIEISLKGAKSLEEAKLAAQAVANYSLLKAAMFGGNPNWGRVVAAIGAVGIPIDQNKFEISFNNQKVFRKGRVFSLKFKNALILSKLISIDIHLHKGNFSHKVYTCDLTPEYVRINAEYN